MKTLSLFSKMGLLFAILFSTYTASAQTPVEKYGQLQINNGQVSDEQGNPVTLRGMSLFWSGYPEGEDYYDAETVKYLRDEWCVDVVRAAMSVETGNSNYVSNPSQELEKIKTVIDACIANGLYVVVDFHTHNAPTYESQAETFFEAIANEYGDEPNIIYEPYNEPISQDWSSVIKPYHNNIISTIRAIDDNNIIVCGTKNYSQDVDVAANDPVTGTNVAYTLHYYANSHQASLRQKTINAMSQGAAIFATEYGTCNATGDGGFNASESQVWWDFLDENKISSCNWSVSNKDETASILQPGVVGLSEWSPDQLTQSGDLVKNYLEGKCNVDVITGSVSLSFTDDQTQFELGDEIVIDAATTVSSGGSIGYVEFYSNGELIGTDETEPYSLSVSDLAAGGHDIEAKSFTSGGELIGESPLYVITIVGASDVSTTGITDQFESEEQFVELTGGVTGESCADATDAAAAGIFWFTDTDPETAFKAEASRTGDGSLQYVISQEENAYNVIGFNFGEYCSGDTKEKYTLDLTENSVLNLNVSAPESNTEDLDLKFQMKDINGNVLAFQSSVLDADGEVVEAWYQHEIGYSKNHSTPDYVSLSPGMTSNFEFDFSDALTISNPNNPEFPADINTSNESFDYSQVSEIVIIPVNAEDTGDPDFAPEAFTDQEIYFSGLTLGDPDLGENFCTTPPAPSPNDVTYCYGETEIEAVSASGIEAFPFKWYSTETDESGSITAPIPSADVAGTSTFYATQVVDENSSCESERIGVDVTILEETTATAEVGESASTGPSVELTGSGSEVGTWSLESGPAGVDVTYDPSADAASVTANGLTEIGEYVFNYTVSDSCAEAVGSVTVDITSVTSVSKSLSSSNAEIYPNPVDDFVSINVSDIQDVSSVKILDVFGRTVYTTTEKGVIRVDMSSFKNGTYLVRIETSNGVITDRLVK